MKRVLKGPETAQRERIAHLFSAQWMQEIAPSHVTAGLP